MNSNDREVDATGAGTLSSKGGSAERFGYEWDQYPEMRAAYEEQFLRWTPQLSKEDWKGETFLDVGCGMGRNSYWPMKYGAAGGVAIDIDERSLRAARETLAEFPAVRVEEGDAYDIRYKDEFDIAFSIGVVQVLEFPEEAIRQMRQAVKPGGKVLIWVYGRENSAWIVHTLSPVRKLIFRRLPVGLVHFLSFFPAVLLYVLLRLGFKQSNEYFRLARTFSFSHLRSIIFDQFLPRVAHYWRREEVGAMMKNAGLVDVQLAWVNQISWTAIGARPE